MTPLMPVYRVCVQCFTPGAGSRLLIIADEVSFNEAWLAMLHYIQPTRLWIDSPYFGIQHSELVLFSHFIISRL